MVKIKFAKLREDAIIPSKRDEDGCYDVYACTDEKEIVINPGEIVFVPTGIASAIPEGYRFGFRERGSTGKICMSVRAGQIDSGYRGEWFVALNNTGNKPIIITSEETIKKMISDNYEKYPIEKAICQAALEIDPKAEIEVVSLEEVKKVKSERKEGKLGSSNK